MVAHRLTVAEMVDEILIRFERLDPRRKYMYIKWLQAHGCQVKNTVHVNEGLIAWLESMQYENIQWECRLILVEITWWATRMNDL